PRGSLGARALAHGGWTPPRVRYRLVEAEDRPGAPTGRSGQEPARVNGRECANMLTRAGASGRPKVRVWRCGLAQQADEAPRRAGRAPMVGWVVRDDEAHRAHVGDGGPAVGA